MIANRVFVVCLLILPSMIASCSEREKQSSTQVLASEKRTSKHFNLDVIKWRKEFLSPDSMTIHGGQLDYSLASYFNFTKDSSVAVIHPKITFSGKTQAHELGRLFPESCKLTKPGGNAWRGKIEVFASEHDHDHRVWVFVFKNEELKLMYLYDPFAEPR